MSSLEPIINLGSLYANGCHGIYLTNTTRSIGVGQLRDSTNTFDIVVNSVLPVSSAFVGAYGLDTGTVAANTMYGVFVIYDPTLQVPVATLLSTSLVAPVMPSLNGVTYSAFRLVDFALTDGSANFVNDINTDSNGSLRFKQYTVPIAVLTGGNATTATNISLGSAVPPINFGKVQFLAVYQSATATNTAKLYTPGIATAHQTISAIVAAIASFSEVHMVPSLVSLVPTIQYALTNGSDGFTLNVLGYEFHI